MEEKRSYWKEEEELLLKDWADKAQCYELLHNKSHLIYKKKHTGFVIPVIIISTITGTANFAQDKIDENYRHFFVMSIGTLNIIAAIITTVGQFLKLSELTEAHRVASYSWGKFYRTLKTELAKHPLDRIQSIDMLKIAKEEYDHLIEISPAIPKNIINNFKSKFKNNNISKPEICDVINTTNIYNITKEERDKMAQNIYNTNNHLTEKFKESFFKINNRYPTDDEINLTLENIYNNELNIEESIMFDKNYEGVEC